MEGFLLFLDYSCCWLIFRVQPRPSTSTDPMASVGSAPVITCLLFIIILHFFILYNIRTKTREDMSKAFKYLAIAEEECLSPDQRLTPVQESNWLQGNYPYIFQFSVTLLLCLVSVYIYLFSGTA